MMVTEPACTNLDYYSVSAIRKMHNGKNKVLSVGVYVYEFSVIIIHSFTMAIQVELVFIYSDP